MDCGCGDSGEHLLTCPLHTDYQGDNTIEFTPEAERRSPVSDYNRGTIHLALDVDAEGNRVVNLYCFNQPVALSADDVIELCGLLSLEAVKL
jgi:hypothetical protein